MKTKKISVFIPERKSSTEREVCNVFLLKATVLNSMLIFLLRSFLYSIDGPESKIL